MAKAKDKLKNVNVPELFYQHFLKQITGNPLIDKITGTQPTPRGRGFSRVLDEVTEAQWNELYELAIDARGQMSGAERETVLRAAICAKAMAERMEKAGVANPQPFVATRTRKAKSTTQKPATDTAPVTDPNTLDTVDALNSISEDATGVEDTDLSSIVPTEPATLETADDVPASTDEELDGFGEDISYG